MNPEIDKALQDLRDAEQAMVGAAGHMDRHDAVAAAIAAIRQALVAICDAIKK
jgi:hypothetical protein